MRRTSSTRSHARGAPPPNWREVLLEQLRNRPHVEMACEEAKVSRSTAYRHRREDPEFAKAWDDALDEGYGVLEDEIFRRGVLGVDEPVFQQGEQVGVVRRYSDTLLLNMVRARRPNLYRERLGVEHSGPGGGPIPMTIADVKAMVAANRLKPDAEPTNGNGRA